MLILSRRVNEEIVIGDGQVQVVVVGLGQDTVLLEVEAPPSLSVHRREVFDAIRLRPDESKRGIGGQP